MIERIRRAWGPTFRYWMETEVHVYGFSIAANVLLSFFPFLIVMVSICRYILHWEGAVRAIQVAVTDYFPEDMGAFVWRNLMVTVGDRGPVQVGSVLLLLFTANGIFEPLEVALNRAWGIKENRSYFKNQIVSLGLIFACGALALVSTVFTALNRDVWMKVTGENVQFGAVIGIAFFKAAALPLSILMLYLVYWLLPNARIPKAQIVPVAILVGVALEGLKYLNLLAWPWLSWKLKHEYGPFVNSVAIILFSFIASMVVLAGAEWSARRQQTPDKILDGRISPHG